jgi:phospholipase C
VRGTQPSGKSLSLIVLLTIVWSFSSRAVDARKPPLDRIEHVVILFLENRSFDHLYGLFPGADGIGNSGLSSSQVSVEGRPFSTLPEVLSPGNLFLGIDTRFGLGLPNGPFRADRFVALDEQTVDLVHRFYQEQAQIDGGKMDKFVAFSAAGALPMGYVDGGALPLYRLAEEFTLADHFFHAAFGGAFLNHVWLICACTPRYDQAPPELVAQVDGSGHLQRDGAITPDGYAVNTIEPRDGLHSPTITDPRQLLPPQTMPTIGDRLTNDAISWAWYSGGFAAAAAGHPDPTFIYHHQPFQYFAGFGVDEAGWSEHLRDERDMLRAISDGTLPAVSFYKPIGTDDEHPGYANLLRGDYHAAGIVYAIQQSMIWDSTVIIVTYAENGGIWDHVPPPKIDRWGPGTRVPAIVISPFAKRHFVDQTQYDTTSILRLIEERWGLTPLGERDSHTADFRNALDLDFTIAH